MSLSFKNLGHAIASGAKNFEKYAQEALGFLHVIQGAQPAVELVVKAVAPQAAKFGDLAFHILGDVVHAVEKVEAAGSSAVAAAQSSGLNLQLDQATVAAVKEAAEAIKAVLQARGAAIPAA
jgi:hypothetical protein